MARLAIRAASVLGYRGIGTIEFVIDIPTGRIYFLEMTARLQADHPVTEMVTGIDLVSEQLLIAAGEHSTLEHCAPVVASGHAIEFRICAEDSAQLLEPVLITQWVEPSGGGVRVESGYEAGNEVTTYYDPLMAKVVVWGRDRREAMTQLLAAVSSFRITGPRDNRALLVEILDSDSFYTGDYDTSLLTNTRAARA